MGDAHGLRLPDGTDPRSRRRAGAPRRRLARPTTSSGTPDTLPVTMEEMLHHTKAVTRGVEHAMVVGDMPFLSYQASREEGIRNAGRFLKEGGAHAVKIEGARVELVHDLVERRHPGDGARRAHAAIRARDGWLSACKAGGRTRRGSSIKRQALEKAGAFSIVLEGMPAELGAEITQSTSRSPRSASGPARGPTRRSWCSATCSGSPSVRRSSRRRYADLRGAITDAADGVRP